MKYCLHISFEVLFLKHYNHYATIDRIFQQKEGAYSFPYVLLISINLLCSMRNGPMIICFYVQKSSLVTQKDDIIDVLYFPVSKIENEASQKGCLMDGRGPPPSPFFSLPDLPSSCSTDLVMATTDVASPATTDDASEVATVVAAESMEELTQAFSLFYSTAGSHPGSMEDQCYLATQSHLRQSIQNFLYESILYRIYLGGSNI